MGEVVLVRHGETDWSRTGRHTSRTDLPLTDHGVEQARALGGWLAGRRIGLVLTSPMQRAAVTARLAGLPDPVTDPDLREWDYGSYEGRTTPEIRAESPGWTVWTGRSPGGETAEEVGLRCDRVLDRVRSALAAAPERDVALVGHGHALRVLAARWIGLRPEGGALLGLDTATVCVLGAERERPVLRHWNVPMVVGTRTRADR